MFDAARRAFFVAATRHIAVLICAFRVASAADVIAASIAASVDRRHATPTLSDAAAMRAAAALCMRCHFDAACYLRADIFAMPLLPTTNEQTNVITLLAPLFQITRAAA